MIQEALYSRIASWETSLDLLLYSCKHGAIQMEILIIDDHALFRDGLSYLLKQLAEDVSIHEANDESAALAVISNYPVLDLVLLDLTLGDSDGMATLVRLRALAPEIPVIVISAMEESGIIQKAMDSGALGYIPKSSNSAIMLSAVRLVMSGGIYLPPAMMTASANRTKSGQAVENNLTQRQTEVLHLMARGLTNKAIAVKLKLGESTIKTHVRAILRFLQADNRTRAVVTARKNGMVSRD